MLRLNWQPVKPNTAGLILQFLSRFFKPEHDQYLLVLVSSSLLGPHTHNLHFCEDFYLWMYKTFYIAYKKLSELSQNVQKQRS